MNSGHLPYLRGDLSTCERHSETVWLVVRTVVVPKFHRGVNWGARGVAALHFPHRNAGGEPGSYEVIGDH